MVTEAQSIEEFEREVEARIAEVKHYRSGKIDTYGRIVGVEELTGELPFERQDHHLDKAGNVLRLDRYEREFSKPRRRFYHYPDGLDKVAESVWFDRYGKIENIHRYLYCPDSGRMVERAEYNREGGLYYRILSSYHDNEDLPCEDVWVGPDGNLIKRYAYTYDDSGELQKEEHYGKQNILVGWFEFEYEDDGRLIFKAWFSGDQMQSIIAYDYDGRGRVVEVVLADGEDIIEARQTLRYDELGNVIEEKWFDRFDQVTKHLRF